MESFIFLQNGEPKLVRQWGGQPWLFWLHPDKRWVSERPLTLAEVDSLPRNLSDAEQGLYRQETGLPAKVARKCGTCSGYNSHGRCTVRGLNVGAESTCAHWALRSS